MAPADATFGWLELWAVSWQRTFAPCFGTTVLGFLPTVNDIPIGQYRNRVSFGDRIPSDKLVQHTTQLDAVPEAHTISTHLSTAVVNNPYRRLATVMMIKSG